MHGAAEVVDHHRRAATRQVEGVEPAEPAAGSGDDRDLAGVVDHVTFNPAAHPIDSIGPDSTVEQIFGQTIGWMVRRRPVADDAGGDRLQALGMLASALAGRPVAVVPVGPGEPSWTDGQSVFIDPSALARANLESIAVHASLIAAGSLDPDIVATAGSASAVGEALSGRRGAPCARRERRPAAGRVDIAGRPRNGKAQRLARVVYVGRVGQGRAWRSTGCVRCHPRQEGGFGQQPGGRRGGSRNGRSRPAPRAQGGARGTRRRRGRRHRRPRPVHQPRRRGWIHRQVAEEDVVVGAEVGQQRRRTAWCRRAHPSHELGEPGRLRGVLDGLRVVRGGRRHQTRRVQLPGVGRRTASAIGRTGAPCTRSSRR